MTKPPECPSSWAVYVLLATESQRSPPFPFASGVWHSISGLLRRHERLHLRSVFLDPAVQGCCWRERLLMHTTDPFLASLDLLHAYGILTSPTIRSLAYRGIPSSWNTLISVAGERAWPFAARSSYENSSREADIEPHVASKGIVCRFDPYGEKE